MTYYDSYVLSGNISRLILDIGVFLLSDKYKQAVRATGSIVCVGLDPDQTKLPEHLRDTSTPYFEFCRQIVDATAVNACAFKPQFAHFAAVGKEAELELLLHYIAAEYPNHLSILDAKRGDIGSTAAFYAQEAFARYKADAVTVNPYLGEEALTPFLAHSAHGIVVLCRTSNASSDELQNYGQPPVYEKVVEMVQRLNTDGQCMLVTGATHPEELASIRQLAPTLPFLVPGIGAQGGDLQAVMQAGLDAEGEGLLISSSRAIIYAGTDGQFASAAGQAAQALKNSIIEIKKSI